MQDGYGTVLLSGTGRRKDENKNLGKAEKHSL